MDRRVGKRCLIKLVIYSLLRKITSLIRYSLVIISFQYRHVHQQILHTN